MRCPTLAELPPPPPGKTGWPWTEESPNLPNQIYNHLSWPKLSITTPSFNQGRFIEKTIRSVLLQGYPNLEYIIIDGGSTDNSVEIIRKYEPWLTYWVSEPDRGQAHAINKGWAISQGSILHWLNSDDTLMPGSLFAVTKEFATDKSLEIVFGICSLTDENGLEFSIKNPPDFDIEYLLKGGEAPGQPTVFISSDVVKSVGNLNEKLHYTLDWEYWIRVCTFYPKIQSRKLQQILAVWCQWEECKSVASRVDSYRERIYVLDTIFADPNIPDSVLKWQKIAYSRVFLKLGIALGEVKDIKGALASSLQGLYRHPSLFGAKQMAKVILMCCR